MKKLSALAITTLLSTVISDGYAGNTRPDPSTAGKVQILHHEPVPSIQIPIGRGKFDKRTPAAVAGGTGSVTVKFAALGRSFDLILESNDRLYSELTRAQRRRLAEKVHLFRGQIKGMPGSWVRLSQAGQRMSGMIWDGTEAYLIDSQGDVSRALPDDITKSGSNVIYRLSDVQWNDARCALDPKQAPVTDYRGLVRELKALTTALAAASRELRVAVVADTQFVQSHSADPEAAVLAQTNVVDGIYSEQLGVHIKVAEIRALATNGGLTSAEASTLLSQFRTYVGSSGFTNPGLAHLFTGRTMNGGVLGVAYIAALCGGSSGIGVSHVGGSGSLGALTVAHEMGHNFGAFHDNQGGSPCAGTPGTYLMNPYLNGSDQFSQCSIDSIQQVVNNAACIVPIATTPVADVRVNLPTNPMTASVGVDFQYRVEVTNGGSLAATNTSATISIPSGLTLKTIGALSTGSCTSATAQVSCKLGDLGANATRTITLSLMGSTPGQYRSNVAVAADNDSNTGNNAATEVMNIGAAGTANFEAHFDSGTDGFQYVDNLFRGTTQSAYASGWRSSTLGFSGGGLVVRLGGVDDNDIAKMSGGWRRSFTLSSPQRVFLNFRVRLEQTPNYELNEISQGLFSIDGRLSGTSGRDYLAQIAGNGDGGSTLTTGWLTLSGDFGVLAAGTHVIAIGGYNNQKTDRNEQTSIRIDDVIVKTQ